ncbi:MAG: hypothetical protein AAFY57_12360 [Cyanobacteria bacterium J06642_2]
MTDVPSPLASPPQWYVVREPEGHCTICPRPDIETVEKYWGPFASKSDAIARRVGLIRAGHCQPV